jgi:hypothetical protein
MCSAWNEFNLDCHSAVPTLQVLIDPAVDKVEVQGKALNLTGVGEKLFYFVLNKPKVGVAGTSMAFTDQCTELQEHEILELQGYICSNAVSGDAKEGKRVVDLLQPWVDAWSKKAENKVRCL